MTDELVCLFNGNRDHPPCFTPIIVGEDQTEATCPSCGTRHVRQGGRWRRDKGERAMRLRPAYDYPDTYVESSPQIDVFCELCGYITGHGDRTGLHGVGEVDRPVYRIEMSCAHVVEGLVYLEEGRLKVIERGWEHVGSSNG